MSFGPAHEPPRSRHWRHEEYWFQVPLVRLRALDDMRGGGSWIGT
jgi:hypothetical protein